MSINITKNTTNATASAITSQPRDKQGRFVPNTKEVKQQSRNRDALKECAPFIWNFMEQNKIVRDERDHMISVIYASHEEDFYYLFIRKQKSFGFHFNCGNLEEVLSEESVNVILRNLAIMEGIQKFTF